MRSTKRSRSRSNSFRKSLNSRTIRKIKGGALRKNKRSSKSRKRTTRRKSGSCIGTKKSCVGSKLRRRIRRRSTKRKRNLKGGFVSSLPFSVYPGFDGSVIDALYPSFNNISKQIDKSILQGQSYEGKGGKGYLNRLDKQVQQRGYERDAANDANGDANGANGAANGANGDANAANGDANAANAANGDGN